MIECKSECNHQNKTYIYTNNSYIKSTNYAEKTASQKFQQINSVSLYNKIILANNRYSICTHLNKEG